MDRRLAAIVTGMQHSGTTYLNNVINSHSRIMSGFECGILLGLLGNFETVKPFSDWLKTGKTHFGLPDNYLHRIKNMNYEQVYKYIQRNKGSQNDCHYQTLIKKCPYFTDKTPAYIYQLELIYNKISHLNVPIIITLKKYEDIYHSWVVKRNIEYHVFLNNIIQCIESLKFIQRTPNINIFVFDFDDLINKKNKYNKHLMEIIKNFNKKINLEKLFEEKYNGKIKNTLPYKPFKKTHTNNANLSGHEYQHLYNHLLNSLKVKL